MTPVETLLSRLSGVWESGSGWMASCPAHDDGRTSLGISQGEDGTALVKCYAGCNTSAVLAAVGLQMSELFPKARGSIFNPPAVPKPRHSPRTFSSANEAVRSLENHLGPSSCCWTYCDAEGKPVGLVVRWNRPEGKKDIRPVSLCADGWRVGAMPDPRPLYRLPGLRDAVRVVVAEGEKAADKAIALGFTATTSAGGAGVPEKTDWRPLAGKTVWILPDNDEPGRKYAETVANILGLLNPAPVVRFVELPDLPEGGDIVDWVDGFHDAAEPATVREAIETLARVDAPEPEPKPEDEDGDFRPFPVDALPEPVRGFVVEGASAIGCDSSYLVLPLLVALGSAIGNSRRLEIKRGWEAPPILWGAIVGESGTSKTPAFQLVLKPLQERQKTALSRSLDATERHEADLMRWEKAVGLWKREKNPAIDPPAKPEPPHVERMFISDTTVEALVPLLLANPRGLLVARDELSGWFGSFDRYAGKGATSSDASAWLSTFSAGSVVVDRKGGNPRTIHVPQASICVFGGVQPGILRRVLGSEHRESGLAARLLLTWPPRRPKRWTEAHIDPQTEAKLARLFDRLWTLQPTISDSGESKPVVVRMDEPAKAAWIEWYNAHAEDQAKRSGDLAAAWSKLEEYAARLALVVHFARSAAEDPTLQDANVLDSVSMSAGVRMARWFANEALRVYAMLTESETEAQTRTLSEWIRHRGGSVSTRDVQQGFRPLKEPGLAEKALDALVLAGIGGWEELPTTGRGGRPSRIFHLSAGSAVRRSAPTES